MLGETIRELAAARELTFNKIAEAVGVREKTVWSWASNRDIPSKIEYYVRLAKILQTTTGRLLGEPTIDDPMGRMKQLCEVEEEAHKLAEKSSTETWVQFLETLQRAIKDAKEQDAAKERFKGREQQQQEAQRERKKK